ncbi:ROK family transcriptional regulator [Arenibacter sp. BSSL-BM3]|uniref:ROK family transcriptional regulator n=1 Tax=Arenibacter arenosicollis TaxID=2762274 RepID=A0ABR7QKS1_9FLAO|nr:ROK family transcriptional regulator [Arenibacter arenosicollis]MBC8767783.1 ROK family transcriptional regulator [Arenibacter arenosicollis]
MKKEYAKMDAGSLHLANKKVVLKLINHNTQISRSALAKESGLTPPSITRIVDELINVDGLVESLGVGSSSGGRPPMIVKFKNDNNYIIGIDLGATYIRGCMVDLNANFISEIQVPTELKKGFSSIVEKMIKMIHKLQSRKEATAKIWGVGIGVAGLVNSKTGIIESSPDFGWTNIDLRKELESHLDLPFFYDNSTRLMALGEMKMGERDNQKNFAVINIGYGIASGLVVEGNLLKGFSGFAGEFGHISVDTDSAVQCKCGMYGCLEALASGHRIASLGQQVLAENKSEMLKELCNGNKDLITAELVARAAKKGDPASMKIYDDVAEYLCKGIGTIANLLNPETVYIGGGISLNGDLLFDLIEKKKDKYLLPGNARVDIRPSTFGDQATSIGAVSVVLQKILNLELSGVNHNN